MLRQAQRFQKEVSDEKRAREGKREEIYAKRFPDREAGRKRRERQRREGERAKEKDKRTVLLLFVQASPALLVKKVDTKAHLVFFALCRKVTMSELERPCCALRAALVLKSCRWFWSWACHSVFCALRSF